jgi:hypothetical protein
MDPEQFKKQFSGPLEEQSQRLDTTPARTIVIPPNQRVPEEPREEARPQAQQEQPQNPKPETVIRTFQSDTAQAIERHKVSVATIALAENMRKSGASSIANEPPKQFGKKITFFLFSIALIVCGAYSAYYFYQQSPLANPATRPISQQNFVASLVVPDTQKVIDVTGLKSSAALKKIAEAISSAKLEDGQMIEFVLSTQKIDENGKSFSQKILGKDLVSILGVTPPDILGRSITAPWMLGAYQDGMSRKPFIIFTTDFFQNAYIGMIRWEKEIADDMSVLFKYPEAPIIDTAITATTSTSTPVSIAQFFTIKGVWSDTIIKNKDVRVFRNEAGQTLLMYSFIDKNNIVITTGENVIRNIVERIDKRTYVR